MELGSFFLLFTPIIIQFIAQLCMPVYGHTNTSYVRDACSVTSYPDICIHSLASYSNKAKHNPTRWARAGVSVSIAGTKNMSRYLNNLKMKPSMGARNRAALLDCIECFEDSIDYLHKSLKVLRELNDQEFFDQMADVTTWMSTVLTDEDTCLEGFDNKKGREINHLVGKVMNVSYITSNALALVNKLENSGPQVLSR